MATKMDKLKNKIGDPTAYENVLPFPKKGRVEREAYRKEDQRLNKVFENDCRGVVEAEIGKLPEASWKIIFEKAENMNGTYGDRAFDFKDILSGLEDIITIIQLARITTGTPIAAPTQKLRVWWIPQIPCKSGEKPFHVPVSNLAEAKLLLDALAKYDLYQLKHNIKPDFSNMGGLQVWDEEAKEWVDWESADGESFDEVSGLEG